MNRRKSRKASIRWSDGEKCVKLAEERSETVFLVVGVKLTVPFLIGFNEFVGSSHAMTRKHGKTFLLSSWIRIRELADLCSRNESIRRPARHR